jgi:pectinesterase inhibitor-like protein
MFAKSTQRYNCDPLHFNSNFTITKLSHFKLRPRKEIIYPSPKTNMKSAIMTIVLVMFVSLLATLFVAGNACNLVPVLRWSDACLKVCKTTELYNVCQDMLQRAPETAEVTVYALVMAKLARMSYDDTVAVADKLIARGLPRDEREAYQRCIAGYYTARIEMVGVATDLTNCDFARTMREYHYAMAAMDSCGRELKAGTPLNKLNAADRGRTTVAYDLGALVINSRRK